MTETHFNIDEACAELKIGREIYLRIMKRALEQTRGDIEKLHAAHAANDIAVVQSVAHRLKGDYANLRIRTLSAEANTLNLLAKGEYEPQKALELIHAIETVFKELSLFIEGIS